MNRGITPFFIILTILSAQVSSSLASPMEVVGSPISKQLDECITNELRNGASFEDAALACIGFCPQEDTFEPNGFIASRDDAEYDEESHEGVADAYWMGRSIKPGYKPIMPPQRVLVDDRLKVKIRDITLYCSLHWPSQSPMFPKVTCFCADAQGQPPAA